jgi:hypothetical protein
MSASIYECFHFIWPYNARHGEVMQGPDVSFGGSEVAPVNATELLPELLSLAVDFRER